MVLYDKLLSHVSNHKKWLGFFVVSSILVGLSVFVPLPVYAGFGSFLAENLILPLAKLMGSLVVTFIGILISVVQYNDFIYSPAVEKGWVITRDVANMFVIVAMMLTAFGTVFKLEEYQWKHILSKLLIMSVLVNFSKMLTGFMIDAGQVVMLTFVNGFKEAAAGNFINGFHLADMFNFAKDKGNFADTNISDGDLFWGSILALISITITLIVVGVYLVVFIVRIAFLWILVIVSPLAYILKVFPGRAEKKYAEEYFDYLGKYIVTGPILAFFLWMSLAVMQFSSNAGGFVTVKTGDSMSLADVPGVGLTGIGQSEVLLSFMINIAMLIGGLWMTSKLGVVGGGLAKAALSKMEHVGSSIAKAPFKAVAAPIGFAASRAWGSAKIGWNNWTSSLLEAHEGHTVGRGKKALFAVLNPIAAAKGWEARTHELEHEAQEVAHAYGREVTEQFRTGGKLQIPYASFVERKAEDEYMKDYQNMTKEEFMVATQKTENMGGAEGLRRRRAIVKSAASQGYLDDVLRSEHFANKYGKLDGTVYDDETLDNFLYGYMGHDSESMRLMTTDMEKLGKATNHWEYLGHAYKDPKSNSYKRGYDVKGKDGKGNDILKNTWQSDYARTEINKIGGRARAGIAPHNIVSIMGQVDNDGKFIIDHEGQVKDAKWGLADSGTTVFQKKMISAVSDAATLRDIHFSQGRTKEAALSGNYDVKTGEIFVNGLDDLMKIQALFREMPTNMLAYYKQLTGAKDDAKGFIVRVPKADDPTKFDSYQIGELNHKAAVAQEAAMDLVNRKDPDLLVEKDDRTKPIESGLSAILNEIIAGNTTNFRAVVDAIDNLKKVAGADNMKGESEKIASELISKFIDIKEQDFSQNSAGDLMSSKGLLGNEMNYFLRRFREILKTGLKEAIITNNPRLDLKNPNDDNNEVVRLLRGKFFNDNKTGFIDAMMTDKKVTEQAKDSHGHEHTTEFRILKIGEGDKTTEFKIKESEFDSFKKELESKVMQSIRAFLPVGEKLKEPPEV